MGTRKSGGNKRQAQHKEKSKDTSGVVVKPTLIEGSSINFEVDSLMKAKIVANFLWASGF